MEEIYGRKWYMEKGEGFEKHKGVGGWVLRNIRNRSKQTGEDRRKMKSKVESKGR